MNIANQQRLVQTRRLRRQRHVRNRLFGTAERPRLAVFRSSKHIYAQMVNDESGVDSGFSQQPGLGNSGPDQVRRQQGGRGHRRPRRRRTSQKGRY